MKAFTSVTMSSLMFLAHANVSATMRGLATATVEAAGSATLDGKAKFTVSTMGSGKITGSTLTIELDNKFNLKDHTLGKFRLSVTSAKLPLKLDAPPESILKIAKTPADKRTPEQLAEFTNYFRGQDKELARLQREVTDFGEPGDKRLIGAQDLAWALINSPGFLFNH